MLPRHGFHQMIGSDNGPAFVTQGNQGLASILGIDWKFYCAYRPQNSGQVEKNEQNPKIDLN